MSNNEDGIDMDMTRFTKDLPKRPGFYLYVQDGSPLEWQHVMVIKVVERKFWEPPRTELVNAASMWLVKAMAASAYAHAAKLAAGRTPKGFSRPSFGAAVVYSFDKR